MTFFRISFIEVSNEIYRDKTNMTDDIREEVLILVKDKSVQFGILARTVILVDSIYRETVKRLEDVPDEPASDRHFMK